MSDANAYPFSAYPRIPTPEELRARREADSIAGAMKTVDAVVRLLTESPNLSTCMRGDLVVLRIAERRLSASGWHCEIESGQSCNTLRVSAPPVDITNRVESPPQQRRSR